MREIKFRGKGKIDNVWRYGSYVFTDDNKNNPFRTEPFKESHKIIFWRSGDWNMGGWVAEEVIERVPEGGISRLQNYEKVRLLPDNRYKIKRKYDLGQ